MELIRWDVHIAVIWAFKPCLRRVKSRAVRLPKWETWK